LWEYVVGGFMRYKVAEIGPAVDRMLAGQLASLAGKLGPVANAPVSPPPASPAVFGPKSGPELSPAPSGPQPGTLPDSSEDYRLPPARGSVAAPAALAPPAASAPRAAQKPPGGATASPAPLPKPAVKASIKTPIKAPIKAPIKSVPKPPAKSAAKPAPKPANPDDAERRDANAAFDAALGGSTPP
jgi:hypothetical protein